MPPNGPARGKAFKVANGTVAAAIQEYLATCPKFLDMAESTKDNWSRQLKLAARPDTLGRLTVYEIRPALVQALLDGLADRPGKRRVALTAIKAFEKWAIVRDKLPHHITTGCEAPRIGGGHLPWRDEHVALVERAGRGDISRAVTLKANTGQRGSDIVKMRWTDIEVVDGRPGINVEQIKTGIKLWIPFTLPLQKAMAGWERRPGFIVTKRSGRPWGRKALADAWCWERDHNEALEELSKLGLVLHGLRATACVRLYQANATTLQISYMVGLSEAMVVKYLRFSVQKENALAAVRNLDRTPYIQGSSVTPK